MRATADGLNDEVIKLTAEKAALKTELTTRTAVRSQTLAYKTEEAGRYREKLEALEGGIIEILRQES
jgi:hypothetical protein